jgi:hypothetical protein
LRLQWRHCRIISIATTFPKMIFASYWAFRVYTFTLLQVLPNSANCGCRGCDLGL